MNLSKFQNKNGWSLLLMSLLIIATAARTGRAERFALTVGINDYAGAPLKGSENDAQAMAEVLQNKFKFQTKMLLGKSATRAGILGGIESYVPQVKSGDVFIFYFSGHGTVFPDAKSEVLDEEPLNTPNNLLPKGSDYRTIAVDSAICPFDHKQKTSGKPWNNLILDDELFEMFSKFTAKGAQVILISDSCHSGSLGRDLFGQNTKRTTKGLTVEDALGEKWASIRNPENQHRQNPAEEKRKMNNLYVALTASRDDQSAIEYFDLEKNQTFGLFTYSLLKSMNNCRWDLSYEGLRTSILNETEELQESQEAQLDTRFFQANMIFAGFTPQQKADFKNGCAATPKSWKQIVITKSQ